MNIQKIMAAAAITGAFSTAAFGFGTAGVASAVSPSSVTLGTPLPQKPHGPYGPGGGWNGPGPGWYGPGWYGPGLSACISATGPWGYVTGTACI